MAGSATLLGNLVDKLIPTVVDGLRDTLHRKMGVRPYLMHTIKRTWSGGKPGLGTPTDVVVEIRPEPKVEPWDGDGSLYNRMEACGLDEMGTVKLSEVSLTYTYAELTGGDLAVGEEFFVRLTEAHGQADKARLFIHDRPPYKDREKTQGWMLWLRAVNA